MSKSSNYDKLKTFFYRETGQLKKRPDASISIPVNAQGDLETVLGVLDDIANYKGRHTFEVILAINNFPEGQEPAEVELFSSMGVVV